MQLDDTPRDGDAKTPDRTNRRRQNEIARRLAKPERALHQGRSHQVPKLAGGRDVESIIRDLADAAVKCCVRSSSKVSLRAEDAAEERILDALLPEPVRRFCGRCNAHRLDRAAVVRKRLREGELNGEEVEQSCCGGRRVKTRPQAWKK
jgi:ATP-dependent HslUV protease ATP-binding subunit HslU